MRYNVVNLSFELKHDFSILGAVAMNWVAMVVLALGMSMDAFAAALARGAVLSPNVRWMQLMRTGALFGCVEMLAPLIGFALGAMAVDLIQEWDHWVAFVLLCGLGVRMIYGGFTHDDTVESVASETTQRHIWLLVFTAIGTSIDSMIVGVSLAFLSVNILLAALVIGLATTLMATVGLWLGRKLGDKMGKWAEMLGGLVLMGIGTMVLVTHLGLFQAA